MHDEVTGRKDKNVLQVKEVWYGMQRDGSGGSFLGNCVLCVVVSREMAGDSSWTFS